MTTRKFAELIADWGINVDAVAALEKIETRYDLKPSLFGIVDPNTPRDLRMLPQETKP